MNIETGLLLAVFSFSFYRRKKTKEQKVRINSQYLKFTICFLFKRLFIVSKFFLGDKKRVNISSSRKNRLVSVFFTNSNPTMTTALNKMLMCCHTTLKN